MKEPTSKAATPAKATSEAKPAETTKAAKAAKATRPARAKRAASSAKATAVSQLPASTRSAAKTVAKSATKTTGRSRAPSAADYRREIEGLRKEVEQLRARIAGIHQQTDPARGDAPSAEDAHPWLKIAATVGVTFALGKLMQALRIPAAAAVAVPMITAEVNRRFL